MKSPGNRFAWTATVGAKGQRVIPKEARELFGIEPGDTLLLLGDTKRGIAIPPKGQFNRIMAQVFREDDEQ